MPPSSPGIHHITALSGAAQENLDFYSGILGLRCVKRTVNFDDPKTHHLYYGDTVGRPGTLITFFPWPRTRQGRAGAGLVGRVSFSVPEGTIDAWDTQLSEADVPVQRTEHFGTPALQFDDPAGLSLELVASAEKSREQAWGNGTVPQHRAIQGLDAPLLPVFTDDRTPELFTELFGWTEVDREGDRRRFTATGTDVGGVVDVQVRDRHPSGSMGQGAVHHIAFRVRDKEEQNAWQEALRDRDVQVTDVKDRQYFQSVYFRDPTWTSGILFEIATDGPGFLTDESEETLGEALRLPPWLETRRTELETALPTLTPPSA